MIAEERAFNAIRDNWTTVKERGIEDVTPWRRASHSADFSGTRLTCGSWLTDGGRPPASRYPAASVSPAHRGALFL